MTSLQNKNNAKLLIVTQTIDENDPVLGFFVRWVEEFAKRAESVEVICLNLGKSDLPKNVHVHSLGKERVAGTDNTGNIKQAQSTAPSFARRCALRATYAIRFIHLVWSLRKRYDAVFVHMNPEYFVLAGKLWRLMRKRTALWYTHKSVDLKLRIAVLFANIVFTASPESFRLKSRKVHVVGHGIDMELFTKKADEHTKDKNYPKKTFRILTTGRISKTKRIAEMLSALDVLYSLGEDFIFIVAGTPATNEDKLYEQKLLRFVSASPYSERVRFIGAVSHKDIPKMLNECDVFINLSETGSMDKAILEALAVCVPVVTTNVAFRDILARTQNLFIENGTPEKIANTLIFARNADISAISKEIRQRYALQHTIKSIMKILTA